MQRVSAINNHIQSVASRVVHTVLKTVSPSDLLLSQLSVWLFRVKLRWEWVSVPLVGKTIAQRVAFQHIKVFLCNLCTLIAFALSSPFMDLTVIRLEAGVGYCGLRAGGGAAHHAHCSGNGGSQVSLPPAHAWLQFQSTHSTLVQGQRYSLLQLHLCSFQIQEALQGQQHCRHRKALHHLLFCQFATD